MENRRHAAAWTVLLALFVGMCAQTVVGASGEVAAVASTSTTTTVEIPTSSPVVSEQGPVCPTAFCVVYTLRPSLSWSDGSPLGAADFERTVAVMTDPVNGRGSDSGYAHVVSVTETGDGRVMVALDRLYDRWQALFDVLLPREWLPGDLLSGPFVGSFSVTEWSPGDYLVANKRDGAAVATVGGGATGDVEEITFLYQPTPAEALAAFEAGEVDVISTRATPGFLEAASSLEDQVVTVASGPFWEHVTFNLDDPLLSVDWVRRVIAMSIDRPSAALSALGEIEPGAPLLGNTLVLPANPSSISHYDVGFDPAGAEEILLAHGCERGGDGIYVCDGNRMSFSWLTTSGDPDRQGLASQVESTLADIGVELRPAFLTPSELLTPETLYGDADVWQLINFSWNAASDPSLAATMYDCAGPAPNGYGLRNVSRYCSEATQELIDQARATVDPSARVAAYNAVDAAVMDDLAVVPLYQKPMVLMARASLMGPEPSLGPSTDLWNVTSWKGMSRVIVAVDAEPDRIDPIRGAAGADAMVLSVLYPGVFGVTPGLDYRPLLVESVETIINGS